ncbi:hypothetical protein BTVI_09780 [Pitangus sulphuratus]|nr:hypothetical protein BTVI_09780 [Pitangus sulphuratus]
MALNATSSVFLSTSRNSESTTSLGSPFQSLITLCEEILPNVQPKPPLAQLKLVPSCPTADCLVEETDTHLATPSCQGVVGSEKISPEPPLLQAKQPHIPQPLPTGLVLQSVHQPCCSSLDLLQPLNILPELRGPELDTALQVWPHQCQVRDQNHFPGSAGHTVPDPEDHTFQVLGPSIPVEGPPICHLGAQKNHSH